MSRRVPCLAICLALISSAAHAAPQRHTIDLATAGSAAERISARKSLELVITNQVPSARYNVSFELRAREIDALPTSAFSIGGSPLPDLTADQSKTNPLALRGVPDCAPELAAFRTVVLRAKTETRVKALIDEHLRQIGAICRPALEKTIHSLTTAVYVLPNIKRQQELAIEVEREGTSPITWRLVLVPGATGTWDVGYGFTFVPNRDERYVTRADPDDPTMFRIARQADREDLDFLPSIFFGWNAGNGHGVLAGLGFDLEDPSLFVGYGYRYWRNVTFTAGLAVHRRTDLVGTYDVGQVIDSSIDSSALLERSYEPNVYFGVAFRFGSNIFAQRAKAQAAQAEATAKKAKAEADAAKLAQQHAACLETCVKQIEAAHEKAKAACKSEPSCLEVARSDFEAGKALCNQRNALGTICDKNEQEKTPSPVADPPLAPARTDTTAVPPVDESSNAEGPDPNEPEVAEANEASLPQRCATPSLSTEKRQQLAETELRFMARNPSWEQQSGVIVVPVAFHAIHDSNEGFVTYEQAQQLIAVVNGRLVPHGFELEMAHYAAVHNPTWFRMPYVSDQERAAKQALGRDTSRYLNIYSVDIVASASQEEVLGWASLPIDLASHPEDDGIVLDYRTLPGGTPPTGLGMTAVHEVGHWLGLDHTYAGFDERTAPRGGCVHPGDGIPDTPYQAHPIFGPGVGRTCPDIGTFDTCSKLWGPDPIDNYMGVADDRCMTTFTPGQVASMRRQTGQYRRALLASANPTLPAFEPIED